MLNKKALAGAPSTPPVFVEDVFSTYLYTGNSSTQTITNGIDLSGKGGLVWIKMRATAGYEHVLTDTVRGAQLYLSTDNNLAQQTGTNDLTAFTSTGFSIGSSSRVNHSVAGEKTFVSWTFRKQAKFFDVVTWSGDSTSGRQISHNLGSTPGMVVVKSLATDNWCVWHRGLTSGRYIVLNSTAAQTTAGAVNRFGNGSTTVDPTSTNFTVGSNGEVNQSGNNYVAYLFAHDAGGFGTSGTDNVISCGSYTGSGGSDQDVSLGFEPQMMIVKCSSEAKTDGWIMVDTMRGMDNSANAWLFANTTAAESAESPRIIPTATGFRLRSGAVSVNDSGKTFIYIAIRRGPMKTPTSGTSVFSPITSTQATGGLLTPGFTTDLAISINRASQNRFFEDRLRGFAATSTGTGPRLYSDSTAAESTGYAGVAVVQNTTLLQGDYFDAGASMIRYMFSRASGFFDEVCYTGTGSTTTITHNLGVTPELVITKSRSQALGWVVWTTSLTSTSYWIRLDDTMAQANSPVGYGGTFSASNYTIANTGPYNALNNAGSTYVAYLFATVAGVSKVGSYTGTGTTQTINCGFTAGARFVLIKRTDSTGDWYVWDTARNIISGNDPYLLLNSTAAEVTNTDYIDPVNSGFELSSTAPAAINANGGSFIFMAIA